MCLCLCLTVMSLALSWRTLMTVLLALELLSLALVVFAPSLEEWVWTKCHWYLLGSWQIKSLKYHKFYFLCCPHFSISTRNLKHQQFVSNNNKNLKTLGLHMLVFCDQTIQQHIYACRRGMGGGMIGGSKGSLCLHELFKNIYFETDKNLVLKLQICNFGWQRHTFLHDKQTTWCNSLLGTLINQPSIQENIRQLIAWQFSHLDNSS